MDSKFTGAALPPPIAVEVVPPVRPPRPPDFSKLQVLLKREQLLIQAERSSISKLYEDIQTESEELILLNWNTQQLGRKVDLLLNNRFSVESWLEFEVDTKDKFVAAYSKFGSKTIYYEKFVSLIWENPAILAEALADNKVIAKYDADEVVHGLLFCLYGNFFPPKEERSVLQIIEGILEANMATQENPQSWLRENTLFTKLFTAYSKNFTSGKVYLKAALKEPVLAVLEDDLLNLEIEPVKVYNTLSPQKRVALGFIGTIDTSNDTALAEHPVMKQLLAKTYQKIILFCKMIIRCLVEKLPTMPFGIRWVCKQLSKAAALKNITPAETFSLLGDLLFLRYISPAIVYPEPYGIILDTPVSTQARRNLTLIAKVLRTIARGSTAKSFFQREKHMVPLIEKLADVKMDTFFTNLQVIGNITEELADVDDFDQFPGRGIKVAISPRYLILFKNIIQDKGALSPAMMVKLDAMNSPSESNDDSLILMKVTEEDSLTLLSEKDVLSQLEEASKEPEDPKKKALRDVKSQIRTILSILPISRALKNSNLVDVLRAEAMAMSTYDARELVTQVGEVTRLLRLVSETYRQGNFGLLYDELLQDFKRRAPYITYLVKLRQDLSMTYDHLLKQKEAVTRMKSLYLQYYKSVRIHNYIEKKEAEIVKFVENFNAIDMLDEKANLVDQFLRKTLDVMNNDPFWKKSSAEEKTEANLMMEKDFMCRIYQNAFFPNGDLDREKDLLFESHITEICKFITMDHEAIQINPRYRSQAPWSPAQRELQKINVYKSPGDKLECIARSCKTIMNLITINGKEVGADDFFPVLVYVILQSNPRCLLTTVQYIKFFFESKASGEASYWWSQFVVAVEFIKTLNPKSQP